MPISLPERRRLVLAMAGAGLPGLPPAAARAAPDEPVDPTLREQVHRLDAVPGQSFVMTSHRPPGAGPFPWLVLSHGTATTRDANLAIGRFRRPALVREWLRRGYAVLVPVRRGYGASAAGVAGPRAADSYGSCAQPDFIRAGEGAAADLLATIHWARAQRDLDPKRWMLVGQSAGGFASIYTASKQPDGLRAVLAFAPGRGGDPVQRPTEPCGSQPLAAVFEQVAGRIRVPVLWFYARNDQYIGERVQRLWFEHFRRGGGRGELVVVPPFPRALGHGVFTSPDGVGLWTAAVARFLRQQRIDLPF